MMTSMVISLCQAEALPQQEPGPAHPAKPGDEPQQPVSPGPGRSMEAFPVRLLVGDGCRCVDDAPQEGQRSLSFCPRVMISPVKPHCGQMMS
jgi:hypothetical protein